MSITICDTHLTRTVRYLSLTFEPVYTICDFLCFLNLPLLNQQTMGEGDLV